MSEAPAEPQDPPPFPPFELRESERVYDSSWCALRRDTVLLRDGSPQEYHVFEVPDAVVVVPALAGGDLVLIGQYRYPHGRTHWEVPAGRIGAGETPLQAAARELEEESGCRAGRWVALPGFYPVNGISPHYVHTFAALDCELLGAPTPDAAEQILARRFEEHEVRALLAAGRIQDAFTALSLFYYFGLGRTNGRP